LQERRLAVVRKVNDQQITNSKDIRKLRPILRDPVARDEFIRDTGSIDSALLKLAPAAPKHRGLAGDVQQIADTIKSYSWTALAGLKGDQELMQTLEETEKLLKELRRTLAKN
jgi:ParB family chromosome partitioning protein